jgi:chromosome segregation ATPase
MDGKLKKILNHVLKHDNKKTAMTGVNALKEKITYSSNTINIAVKQKSVNADISSLDTDIDDIIQKQKNLESEIRTKAEEFRQHIEREAMLKYELVAKELELEYRRNEERRLKIMKAELAKREQELNAKLENKLKALESSLKRQFADAEKERTELLNAEEQMRKIEANYDKKLNELRTELDAAVREKEKLYGRIEELHLKLNAELKANEELRRKLREMEEERMKAEVPEDIQTLQSNILTAILKREPDLVLDVLSKLNITEEQLRRLAGSA